jgi:KaiC/GvpD/RAD55 family RecA-like ATPase
MALEVYHFLLNSDDGELQTVIDHAMPFLQYNTHLAIITGAHRTGKTSLLFQYAYNAALAGKQVMPSLQ